MLDYFSFARTAVVLAKQNIPLILESVALPIPNTHLLSRRSPQDMSDVSQEKEEINGWKIELKTAPGCLGPNTCIATAIKGDSIISATAGDAATARTMLADMIKKRTAS